MSSNAQNKENNIKWRVRITIDYECNEHIFEDIKRIRDPPFVEIRNVNITKIWDDEQ